MLQHLINKISWFGACACELHLPGALAATGTFRCDGQALLVTASWLWSGALLHLSCNNNFYAMAAHVLTVLGLLHEAMVLVSAMQHVDGCKLGAWLLERGTQMEALG